MSCQRGCCQDYKTHIRGINIGSFPTDVTLTERQWDKDMPAYKRLRNDGLQPARIDGSYITEQNAKDEKEVELGRAISPTELSMLKDSNASL